ncbi:MAG TPA: hypothetical protein VNL98_07810 [Gemmatimonadales bacterium]|nr:hypothetical protein [Gemmatimonadales bacterium]
MVTREDIESWLGRLASEGVTAREVSEGLWVLNASPDAPELAVHYNPPVLVLRVKVLELGDGSKPELYRRLLELNATDLVHGSYGIDGNSVVLSDALELENLDFAEFQASYDSIMLALASHLTALAPYRQA